MAREKKMECTETCNLTSLSEELLCHILSYLPLKQVLLIGTLNKNLLIAVELYLRLLKVIDFCESVVVGYMPLGITDNHMLALLRKCPNVEIIRGLHPVKLSRWRLRKSNALSVPGVIDALALCPHLKKVETSNFRLLEAFAQHLPQLEIAGHFRNRDGVFPPQSNQQVKLSPFLRLTSLHLIGVQVPELTAMYELQHLHLQWVCFTRLHPFRAFSATKLQTFVMKFCIGPSVPLRYYPLFLALGCAQDLSRLEIVRVPILGGMIHRSVEEALQNHGFRKISKLVIGDCKGIMESDLGQLMIASSQSLETLCVQASLTKDSLFVSLHFARCDFPCMKTLHLGYVDAFPPKGEWSNDALLSYGLADVPDVPSSITDSGLKTISQLFPNVQNLTITNCHHIVTAKAWVPEGNSLWDNLTCLILERCHCLRLPSFTLFLSELEKIEVLVIKNMFREPPKGCSHVGLSAGTGLGLSSAIVSVQGHHVEAVPENENDDGVLENELENAVEVDPQDEEQDVERDREQNCGSVEAEQHVNAGHHETCNISPSCSKDTSSRRRNKSDVKPNVSNRPKKSYARRTVKPKTTHKRKVKSSHSNFKSAVKSNRKCSIIKKRSVHVTRSCAKKAKNSPHESNTMDNNYTGPITRHRSQMLSFSGAVDSNQPDHVLAGSSGGESSMSLQNKAGSSKSRSALGRKRSRKHLDHGHSGMGSKKASGSTNDLCEEEDVTLVFRVVTQSLLSLTIISCGISEITIDQCPNLIHVEAQTCRILKRFNFVESRSIMKVNLSQCPKLDTAHFVSEIMNLYSKNPIIVYIEPCLKNDNHNSNSMEEAVFCNSNENHSVVVLHEYGEWKPQSVVPQETLLNWLQFVKSSMNEIYPLVLLNTIKSASSENINDKYSWGHVVSNNSLDTTNLKYPWNHHMDRIFGISEAGEYVLTTNNPIFATLWRKYENSMKSGWFHNSSCNQLQLFSSLTLEIAELVECNSTIGNYYIGFYINMRNACHQ